MSKHGVGHSHKSVVFDVHTKTHEELEELYGIEIDDDGTVYDPCEMREYDSLSDWAISVEQAEQEEVVLFEKRGKRGYDPADYYD
jgi:hypothetical protein